LDPAGHVPTSATGEDKYVPREIGAADAGMQVKFAAGGDSQIVATGGSGTVLGAEDAQVQQQVQKVLPSSAGRSSGPARVAGASCAG
jgi:hypothetical protein